MTKEEIISVRKRLDLSQSDFAQALGVKTATVAHWETGRSHPSRLHQVVIQKLESRIDDTSVRDVIIGFAIAGGVTAFLAWLWSESNKQQ